MRPPADAITIFTGWSRVMDDEDWTVWEDPNSSTWWHTSVVELKSGAVFAILDDDDQMGNDSDLYAVFLGTREGQELPEDDRLVELGRTAIAVFTQYFNASRGNDEDEPQMELPDFRVN